MACGASTTTSSYPSSSARRSWSRTRRSRRAQSTTSPSCELRCALPSANQKERKSTITRPSCILSAALSLPRGAHVQGDAYFYLAAVAFIRRVKKGPFGEHSPMLNDISGLRDWRAVASGLSRMYEGEVLGKLPVVQHLPFGTLLSWPEDAGS